MAALLGAMPKTAFYYYAFVKTSRIQKLLFHSFISSSKRSNSIYLNKKYVDPKSSLIVLVLSHILPAVYCCCVVLMYAQLHAQAQFSAAAAREIAEQ